jgi:hypothetical protein
LNAEYGAQIPHSNAKRGTHNKIIYCNGYERQHENILKKIYWKEVRIETIPVPLPLMST